MGSGERHGMTGLRRGERRERGGGEEGKSCREGASSILWYVV